MQQRRFPVARCITGLKEKGLSSPLVLYYLKSLWNLFSKERGISFAVQFHTSGKFLSVLDRGGVHLTCTCERVLLFGRRFVSLDST